MEHRRQYAVGMSCLLLVVGAVSVARMSGASPLDVSGLRVVAGSQRSSGLSSIVISPVTDTVTVTVGVRAPVVATTPTTVARPLVRAAGDELGFAPPLFVGTSPDTPVTTTPMTTSTSTTSTSTTSTIVRPKPVTTTTGAPCRNSSAPACGPFRFEPQPGQDRPMTVRVAVKPAAPRPGEQVVFQVTLTDPDGASYGATLFGFGDSGLGEISNDVCTRFGPWDPPLPDPAHSSETLDIPHTYFGAGTYVASFGFDAGPFSCVDSVTGRGDRPYASSATGTVTVVVG